MSAPSAAASARHAADVAAGQRLRLRVVDRRPPRAGRAVADAVVERAANWAETTAPSAAIASRPATRATALLTPEATPTWRSSTESSTVVVSGATVIARPRPKRTIAGRTSVR